MEEQGTYCFTSELEFLPAVKALMLSEDLCFEFGRNLYLKAGAVGMPDELAGKVGLVLARPAWQDAADASWQLACVYETATGRPIESVSGYGADLFGGYACQGVAGFPAARARTNEIDRAVEAVEDEARRSVWDAQRDLSSLEEDREVVFGSGRRFDYFSRKLC